jgi:PAS domain S-box-containing protein
VANLAPGRVAFDGLRFSLATKIFLGFVAVLSTFAAVAFVSVGQVRSVARDLQRIKDDLLGLARTSAQLETLQQNRFRDLRRALEEEDPRNRAVILRVGLAYYPEVVRTTLRELQTAVADRAEPGDAAFWRSISERLEALDELHAELDEVTRSLLAEIRRGADVTGPSERVRELEVALRSESYRLTKAINDQMELAVRRAVQHERTAVWRILVVTLGALLLGLVVMALAGRSLAPIGRLVDYARALSRGDYDRPLGVARSGELGHLAEELELMARARKERERELGRQAAELERAYRRVEELKRYHESIVRSLRTGVVVLDRDLRIASTNRAAHAVWGLDAEVLKGRPLESTPLGQALAAVGVSEVARAQTRTFESVPVGARLADITTAPLEDERGETLGSIVSLEDVTETVRTKEALIRSERLAAIGRMSAHVTHEVRNPLSSIGLNAEMLEDWVRRQPESEDATQLCRAIGREIDRLTELTDEYLRFARLPRPEVRPLDLEAFLASMAAFLGPDLRGAGIDVRVEVDPDATEAWADPDQLRQAVLNLARNAKEAMPSGGTLTLATSPGEDGATTVHVRDEGVGIPEEARERIFDPFYSTKLTGTGLGLALTQQIVQEHGGTLMLATEVNRGTDFGITLHPPPTDAVEGSESPGAGGPEPAPPAVAKSAK